MATLTALVKQKAVPERVASLSCNAAYKNSDLVEFPQHVQLRRVYSVRRVDAANDDELKEDDDVGEQIERHTADRELNKNRTCVLVDPTGSVHLVQRINNAIVSRCTVYDESVPVVWVCPMPPYHRCTSTSAMSVQPWTVSISLHFVSIGRESCVFQWLP